MELTKDDYQRQLLQLLPEGPMWPRDPDTFMAKVLGAAAEGFARVDASAAALVRESDPRDASQLLDDWERNAGLPDECLSPATNVAERRRRLHQKVVRQGGQSTAFFISLLASLGYPDCTITEFRPFRAGSKCNAGLNQGGWRYAWRVNVPAAANVKFLNVSGRVNEPLASWGDAGLACLLAKYKPAHTIVYISYGEGA